MAIEEVEDTKLKLAAISPTICMAKWYQTTLHLHNGNTQSCHHVKSHKIELSELEGNPSALHNTTAKKSVRRQMLQGSAPSECDYCWRVERAGELSDRHYKSSENWAKDLLTVTGQFQGQENVDPTYLEVSFDNICNFKCLYCSPAYSSLWEQEIKTQGPYPTSRRYNNFQLLEHNKVMPLAPNERQKYIDAFWGWWPTLSPGLRVFRITGGEPLMSSEVWRVLDDLAQKPKLKMDFAINSNLGASEKLIQKLIQKINALEGKLKHFTLYTSIDSVGLQAEYIRTGLKTEVFFRNIRSLLAEVKFPITLSFMITVNAFALPGLQKLFATIAQLREEFPYHHIGMDTPYLRNPEHLSVFILPSSFEKYMRDAITYLSQSPQFFPTEVQRISRLLEVMQTERLRGPRKIMAHYDFHKFISEVDRRRGTDFLTVFPEFEKLYKQTAYAIGIYRYFIELPSFFLQKSFYLYMNLKGKVTDLFHAFAKS